MLFVAGTAALFGMQFAARRSRELTIGLLALFGLFIGLAVAPTLAFYASQDPQALWQSGGATALFIAGFGAGGYATRRDLTTLARISVLGADRPDRLLRDPRAGHLRRAHDGRLPAAAALDRHRLGAADGRVELLDILNVFLFFLQIFSRGNDR